MSSRKVNITLNTQMLATLDLLAEKNAMTRSEFIRSMIAAEYGNQLDSVDAVTSDDVFKRMDSMY